MAVARAHLFVSDEPLFDGSHRGVSIAELSRRRAEMLSAAARAVVGSAGDAWTETAHERRAAGAVRDVCGTVCLAEYSDFGDLAGDDCGALAPACGVPRRFLAANERGGIGVARAFVGDRGDRWHAVDCVERRPRWIERGDGCPFWSEANAGRCSELSGSSLGA